MEEIKLATKKEEIDPSRWEQEWSEK